MNRLQLKQQVIAEIQRIANIDGTITLAQYELHCNFKYRWELARYYLDVPWGLLKKEAGISFTGHGGAKKIAVIRQPKITKRNCNMRDEYHGGKDFWFDAKDNFYSCPACTNRKNMSEMYGGFDEI